MSRNVISLIITSATDCPVTSVDYV
jgi:hypothetical protein